MQIVRMCATILSLTAPPSSVLTCKVSRRASLVRGEPDGYLSSVLTHEVSRRASLAGGEPDDYPQLTSDTYGLQEGQPSSEGACWLLPAQF